MFARPGQRLPPATHLAIQDAPQGTIGTLIDDNPRDNPRPEREGKGRGEILDFFCGKG